MPVGGTWIGESVAAPRYEASDTRTTSMASVSAQRTSFLSRPGFSLLKLFVGSVGSGCAHGNDSNQPTDVVGSCFANVMRPSGVMSWMTSSSCWVWAMTRLSGGPGAMYMAHFGPGSPMRAIDVFCQSGRFSHRYQSVSYTHLRAHETGRNLVCRLL